MQIPENIHDAVTANIPNALGLRSINTVCSPKGTIQKRVPMKVTTLLYTCSCYVSTWRQFDVALQLYLPSFLCLKCQQDLQPSDIFAGFDRELPQLSLEQEQTFQSTAPQAPTCMLHTRSLHSPIVNFLKILAYDEIEMLLP